MSPLKYQGILGSFVAITIILGLILIALIALPGDEELKFDFPYTFGTDYITPLDWPPQVQVINTPLSCTQAGVITERAGRTELRNIGGRNFCITELVGGAAGSIYAQYAYAFEHDRKTVILTFSTRAPQCGNYPEPEMRECEIERGSFNLDYLIGQVVEEAQ